MSERPPGPAAEQESSAAQGEAPAAPSRRTWWRVLRGGLIGIFVTLLLLTGLVAWLTQTTSGRAFLLQQLESALSGSVFSGQIRAEELSGPVFGRVRLEGVSLTDDRQEFAASLESVEMSYRVLPLLRSRLEIEHIVVEGAVAEGHIRPDGTLNLASLFVPSEPKDDEERDEGDDEDKRGFAVLIERFELNAERFSIDDRRVGGELVVALRNLQTNGRFELHHDGSIDTMIDELGGSIEFGLAMGRSFDARVESLGIDVNDRLLDFAAERLTLGETGLFGFEGRLYRAIESPVPFEAVDVSIPELLISPDDIEAFVPGIPLTTNLEIDAAVNGPVSDVRLSATLSAQEQAVIAQMSIDLSDPIDPALRGRLSVSRFKPQRWLSIAGLSGELNAGVGVTIRGLTASSLSIDLQTDIQSSHLFGYRLDSGRIAMSYANNEVQLETFRFGAGRTTLSGEGEASLDGSVDLALAIQSPELAELAPEGGDLPLPLRGGLEMDLTIEGVLPDAAREEGGLASPLAVLANVVPGFDITLQTRARSLAVGNILVQRADLTLRGVRGERPDLGLELVGGDIDLGGSRIENLDVSARLDDERFSLQAESALLDVATLALAIDGRWSTSEIRARLQRLEMTYQDLSLRNAKPASIVLALGENATPQLLRIRELDLVGSGASLSADGRYDLVSGSLQGALELNLDDLSELAPISPALEGLAGRLALGADVTGTLARPRYDARIEAEGLAFAAYGPLSLRGALRQERRRLVFEGVEATYRGEALLSLEGQLPVLPGFADGLPRLDGRGEADARVVIGPLDIARASEGVDAAEAIQPRGTLRAGIVAGGTGDAITLTSTIDLSEAGFALGLEEEAQRIDGIDANLGVYYDERSALLPFIALNGSVRYNNEPWLNVSGDVEAPWRAFIEGRDDLEATLRAASGQLLFNVPEHTIEDLPPGLLPPELAVGGRVALRGRLSRIDEQAHAQLNLYSDEMTYQNYGPFDLDAVLASSSDTTLFAELGRGGGGETIAHLDATLDAGFGQLLQRGVLGSEVLSLRLELLRQQLQSLPIADLPEELGAETVSGYLDVFGALDDVEARARFALRDVLLSGGQAETSAAFAAELSDRSLSARFFVCGPEGCALSLSAASELPATPWDIARGVGALDVASMPLTAELLADAAPLEAFAPVSLLSGLVGETSGELSADLRVTGTVGAPGLSGRLQLVDGRVEVVPLAKTFENISLDVIAQGQRVEIAELSLREGRGRLEGAGYVVLGEPIERAELDLRLRNFHAADATGAGVFVTSDIGVRALQQPEQIDVDVTMRDTTIVVPDSVGGTGAGGPTSLGESVIFVQDDETLSEAIAAWEERRREETQEREFARPIAVSVRSEDPVNVEHRFADLELSVDLGLRLEGSEIETSGRVEVLDGYAQAIGKRFDVERGLVLFDGSRDDPFDPRIRLEAVHRLPDRVARLLDPPSGQSATVSVLMDTYVSELEIDLRSDPPMSEDEILNVLLTGRPLDADAGEGSALASAGNVLGGLISDQLGDNVVVDDVSIEFDNTEDGQIRSRFEGGRYLDKNERVYASIAFIAGAQSDESVTEVTLQFILLQLRRSSFRLELGFGGVSSGTIEFLYDLRLQRGLQFVR